MNEWNCREMDLEEVIEEMRGMICDVNVEEINAHEGESLRGWTLRWGNKMMNLLAAVEKKTPNFFGMTEEVERQKMTVRDVCKTVVSDLKITFDEDPHDGEIDVIIPVSAEPTEILGEGILNLKVNLIMANGDALIISTNSRR